MKIRLLGMLASALLAQSAMTERCNGPGTKEVFPSREAAREALLAHWKGKRANARQGKVYRCPYGDHYHYTSKRNPGRK